MTTEKRCKHCGRTGGNIDQAYCGWYFKRPDGYECRNRRACAKRVSQAGKWTGTRVLRCREVNGTLWTIRQLPSTRNVWTLTCEYRQHRTMTSHFSIEAAKAHREDVTRSWEARNMREYVGGAR